jgi:hypothetical protein
MEDAFARRNRDYGHGGLDPNEAEDRRLGLDPWKTEGHRCPFCGSTRAVKFSGTSVCESVIRCKRRNREGTS